MIEADKFEQVEVASSQELREWLTRHYAQADSVWLVTYKKNVADKYVSVDAMLDELLCFGWIDGLRRKLDDQKTMQLISPRKAQIWTQTYKVRAQRLIDAGHMHEAGLRSIEAAKANSDWEVVDEVDALLVPADLENALGLHPSAAEYFANCAPSYRRNVLRWLRTAKTEKTRSERVLKIAQCSNEKKRIPQM
jgi:uncharacterized protein YdeI (YjbR/CyaY-like superfamily)